MWKRLVVLLLVASSFSFPTPGNAENIAGSRPARGLDLFPRPPQLNSSEIQHLHDDLRYYFDEIEIAYEKGDTERHARASLALLRHSRKIPIYHLGLAQDLIEKRVSTHIRPHLSFIIDYAHRSLSFQGQKSIEHYDRLSDAFNTSSWPAFSEKPRTLVAFLGASDGNFRAHAEETAYAAATIFFTGYGKKQTKRGYGTSSFLVDLVVAQSCIKSKEKTDGTDSPNLSVLRMRSRGIALCDTFLDKLNSESGDKALSYAINIARGIEQDGIKMADTPCSPRHKDDDRMSIVQQTEELEQCANVLSQSSQTTSRVYASSNYFYEYWVNRNRDVFEEPSLLGGDITQQTDENGNETEQFDWNYSDGSRKRAQLNHTQKTWTESHVDGNGFVQSASGKSNQGKWTYDASYGKDGQLKKETLTETAGDTTTKTEVGYDKKGNVNSVTTTTTTKTENDDDTVTTTTKTTTTSTDDQGNVTTSDDTQTTTGTSRPSPLESSCTKQVIKATESGSGGFPSPFSDVGPLILTDRDPMPSDACIASVMRTASKRCQAMWLCTAKGTRIDDGCNCVNSDDVTEEGQPYSAICGKVMCPEGSSCDPLIGACVRDEPTDHPLIGPGVWPPIDTFPEVPTKLGLDAVITENRRRVSQSR